MKTSTYQGNELDIFNKANNWKEYFSGHICPYIHGHVLEVGAGIGGTTKVLPYMNYESWTCLEPDPNLLIRLSAFINANKEHSKIKFVMGDISSIDSAQRYDTILYIDVLEHIKDDINELNYAVNLFSKDGTLIVLSPAYQWLYSEYDKSIGHFRRYSRQALTEIIPIELELVSMKYLDSVGIIASLVNRIFLHKSNPNPKQILFWDRVLIPCSTIIDPMTMYSFGKTIIGIWKKTN